MKLSINIPENLSEVKLRDYIQLVELFKNAEQEHETVLKIRAVSILTGISLEDVVKIPINELNDIFDIVNKVINEVPKFQPIIVSDGVEYGFIPDMENLATNEYLDLELYFGKDILKTIAILYRPVKNRVKSLYTIEEYKGTKDFEKYNDFPASAYVSCMLFFLDFTKRLAEDYPTIFRGESNGESENGFGSKWGWYIAIDQIAGGDRLKFNDIITKLTIDEFLTHMVYLQDKAKEEERQLKKATENAKRNI